MKREIRGDRFEYHSFIFGWHFVRYFAFLESIFAQLSEQKIVAVTSCLLHVSDEES